MHTSFSRQVVVTGLGIISPVGSRVGEAWENITQGRSGIVPIRSFDASTSLTKIAGEVLGWNALDWIPAKDLRKSDVFCHYAIAAAAQALQDAGIPPDPEFADRIGVTIGTAIGGISEIHRTSKDRTPGSKLSPFFCPGVLPNAAAGLVSIRFGLRGPNFAISTACASGAHAIGLSKRLIESGDADVMVAGGSECVVMELTVSGHNAMRALSTRNGDPAAASRPWDKTRDGFVLGEGAGVIVLEELEHAKKRGASIYARLAGFGMTGDAYHAVAPSPTGEGAARCMRAALADARLDPACIEYVNAHGTSTPQGDLAEVRAIKDVFGAHAGRLMVSSTKSMTGHLLGAAGAIEAVFSILALHRGVVPPTINLNEPDDGCDLDFVPHTAREARLTSVISNSFGFGGTNACLVFRSPEAA